MSVASVANFAIIINFVIIYHKVRESEAIDKLACTIIEQ